MIKVFWELPGIKVDDVFTAGGNTLFAPSTMNDMEMRRSSRKPTVSDKDEDKENTPFTTQVMERMERTT